MMKIFFLPFAGGNKYSYRPFMRHDTDNLAIEVLEYAGRGARSHEALPLYLGAMVDDVASQLQKKAAGAAYCVYGHSMGALLACLATRKLRSSGDVLSTRLFVSGLPGPAALSIYGRKRHLMDKENFLKEVARYGNFSSDMFDEELLSYLEPILRSDFRAIETYRYVTEAPLPVSMTVFAGAGDEDTSDAGLLLWQQETQWPVEIIKMPGSHFFIFNNVRGMLKIMSEQLTNKIVL